MENTYLVVEQDPVVASDLYEIVVEFDSRASVVVVDNMAEAAGLIHEISRSISVIARGAIERVTASGLASSVEATDSRLVLILEGQRASCTALPLWRFVTAPFTTNALTRALESFNASVR